MPLVRLHPALRRVAPLVTLIVGAAACSLGSSAPSGPQRQYAYAVFYGHVAAETGARNITVSATAYLDSVHAVKAGDTAYFGGFNQVVDSAHNYLTFVQAKHPIVLYFNLIASGQAHTGYIASKDTIHALRVRLDTLNGGPHDSVAVNLSLP